MVGGKSTSMPSSSSSSSCSSSLAPAALPPAGSTAAHACRGVGEYRGRGYALPLGSKPKHKNVKWAPIEVRISTFWCFPSLR